MREAEGHGGTTHTQQREGEGGRGGGGTHCSYWSLWRHPMPRGLGELFRFRNTEDRGEV